MLRPTDTTLPTACRLDATTYRYRVTYGLPGQLDATTNRHHVAYGLPAARCYDQPIPRCPRRAWPARCYDPPRPRCLRPVGTPRCYDQPRPLLATACCADPADGSRCVVPAG